MNRTLLALAILLALPTGASAVEQFIDPGTGGTTQGVTAIPAKNTAPLAVGNNSFNFTVTSSDQALPVSPSSPGLVLPGKICLNNPQYVFASGSPNPTPVNINWNGANSVTTPVEQASPGQQEVCWYVLTTTPPHVSVPAGSSSVIIGVQQ